MELIATFVGLALTGVFVGICSGLLGVGGGTIMVPLLRLLFGLDAYMATATSLFTIIPTSISGAVSRIRNNTCYPKLGVALGAGGALTSALGAWASSVAPAWSIILVAALIILYSAYASFAKALKMTPGSSACKDGSPSAGGDDVAIARRVSGESDDAEITRPMLVKGFFIGMAAGLFAGFAGLGGGFLMVPLMVSLLGLSMKKATGTSTVAIVILVVPGVIGHMLLGHVDYLAGIMLAAGSIPGAMLGAKLVARVNERQLRFIFAGFLLLASILLVGKEFGLLG